MRHPLSWPVLSLGLWLALPALAGPTLIRDSRVTDLATTPVLGRGYSMSTNSFQSACLKDVVITEPSYDFQYDFKEITEDTSKTSSLGLSTAATVSSFWVDATLAANTKVASENQRNAHQILVTLNMDTYYASVNEAGTPLSVSAAALLQNQDAPGFFAACGPYYTRGINRNAQFVSVFSYENDSKKQDFQFESELKLQLKGFAAGGSVSTSTAFTEKASRMHLTITSRGWGLGKNVEATLISYDLETFKGAIKDAFKSMQNPLTGRVTSIEVVPWVENTEFQNTLNLRGTDLVDGKEMPLYEKKDILIFNGEFLTELERAARNRLNIYYKAKVCKNAITGTWYQNGKLNGDFAKLSIINHRLGSRGDPKTLGELDARLTESNIAVLWKEYEEFMYLGTPNAETCIQELMRDPTSAPVVAPGATGAAAAPNPGTGRGIFLRRFTSIKSCQDLQRRFVTATTDTVVDDYCMPESQ